jgi:hypothetical protein
MSFDAKRFYELLPVVYRIRDAEQKYPLRDLLGVISEQSAVLEESLNQLYDDQFIETCADWVVPYIGDLIGCRPLNGKVPGIALPRAEVANTIRYRRRKGTAVMLEQLARDVTRWDARVVEFFQLLSWTQYMNHLRPACVFAPNLRQWTMAENLNTAFDTVAHTVDVRHISQGCGRYNLPNIGIFLWRLGAYSRTNSPAFALDQQRWFFNPLGCNLPLFTLPATEDQVSSPANQLNVPMPVSRRVLYERLSDYYGRNKSIFIQADGLDIDINQVSVCDLSDIAGGWAHTDRKLIAIDPELGRIVFPTGQQLPKQVTVSFQYGFSGNISGGQYDRESSFAEPDVPAREVSAPTTIQSALNASAGAGVVEITDNGRYTEALTINVGAGQKIELRAANYQQPTLVLRGDMIITGAADAEITLNGLLITGGTLVVPSTAANKLKKLQLVHCTLAPGISLTNTGAPQRPDIPSLVIESPELEVSIQSCILGGIRAVNTATVEIADSIVDATTTDKTAYASPVGKGNQAGGILSIVNSTIVGCVYSSLLKLVSNSILLATSPAGGNTVPILSERKQAGCVRFSYVPVGAQTPRRFRCQPDLALASRAAELGLQSTESLSAAEQSFIAGRVTPVFTSLNYGTPGYGQLSLRCAGEIRQGADDESEMGAFHFLYQPQRESNLRVRLEEYLRFGMEAGIIYVT